MLKPGIATKALNELMIRYAQDGQLRNVATCLAKGADVDYNEGQLLLTAVYLGKRKIVKLALQAEARSNLKKYLELAKELGFHLIAEDIQDYIYRKGLE